MSGNNESAIDVLAEQIKSRNNPTDLKAAIIGVVVNLEPLTVGIDNELIYLVEGKHLTMILLKRPQFGYGMTIREPN